MQNQKPTATQQVNQLTAQLSAEFIKRMEAQAQVEASDKAIVGIRNLLGGVVLGQQLQQEVAPPTSSPDVNVTK